MKRTETTSEPDDFWVIGRSVKFDSKLDEALERLGFKEIQVRAYKITYEGRDRFLFITDKSESPINCWSVPVYPSTPIDNEQMFGSKIFPIEPPSKSDVITTLLKLRMTEATKHFGGVLENGTLESPVIRQDNSFSLFSELNDWT